MTVRNQRRNTNAKSPGQKQVLNEKKDQRSGNRWRWNLRVSKPGTQEQGWSEMTARMLCVWGLLLPLGGDGCTTLNIPKTTEQDNLER